MTHRILITVDASGLEVYISRLDENGDSLDSFDLKTDEGSALLAKVLSQTLFAFTCLPPSSLGQKMVQWKNSSPSNSSDHGTEHIHPGSAE